jgi:eukaryotic-like serine/threonine-protein kinase
VLEYIEGQPLKGPQAVDDAVRLAAQIVEALDAAHRKGLVHRDLKPANIMVTSEGSVKLLDFGLAKQVTDSDETATMEGMVRGTAAYMAPEQAEGKALDARSDVFSLGTVLYELLSGRHAFAGNSMAQVLSSVLRDNPPPLQAPPALERIVRRCLAKQPEQRYQTMAEVKAALDAVSGRPAKQQPSIAVLPFANMSAEKENEYFSDGLAEEIINALAHISGLKVIARTSAFAFRGKEQDIRKIAEALGVRTILEGSVRRAGNRIRVAAQLIAAEDGSHLWSERYDREMADVFAIQDEISQAIAGTLKLKLAGETRYTPKLPAYEAYLKARYHGAKITPESMALHKDYLEQAIALDPEFALAYTELGYYFLTRAFSALLPAREAMPLARASVERALGLDPSLPEAHAMLGVVAGFYDYDWKEAGRRFGLAMAHEPVPPAVHDFYGSFYLLPTGRAQEGLTEMEYALKEDPLAAVVRSRFAICLLAVGKEAEADLEWRQVLELDMNLAPVLSFVSVQHALAGRFREALVFAERAYSIAPWLPNVIGLLAGVLVLTGDANRAQALLEKLRPGQAYGAPRGLAVFHLLCGEVDRAADWTEKAIEQRDPLIVIFLQLPLAKALHASARWPALAKMINLPKAH